jgi:hypothetical protein
MSSLDFVSEVMNTTHRNEYADYLNQYKFLYYCPNCIRNIQTIEETNKCKFCNGELKLLSKTEGKKISEKIQKIKIKIATTLVKEYKVRRLIFKLFRKS